MTGRRPDVNPYFGEQKTPKNPFSEMYARSQPTKKRGSFFAGMARFMLLIFIGALFGGAGIAAQGYIFFNRDLPSIEKLKTHTPPTVTHFYGSKGEIIGEFSSQRRYILTIDQIPKQLQNAFVAAEDKNFWDHGGVDKEAIIRAARRNLTSGTMKEGASTITQQLAKNLLVGSQKTIVRKIKEAILAMRIERERSLTKEQILCLYLNEIYLGSNAYGVEAAARYVF